MISSFFAFLPHLSASSILSSSAHAYVETPKYQTMPPIYRLTGNVRLFECKNHIIIFCLLSENLNIMNAYLIAKMVVFKKKKILVHEQKYVHMSHESKSLPLISTKSKVMLVIRNDQRRARWAPQ